MTTWYVCDTYRMYKDRYWFRLRYIGNDIGKYIYVFIWVYIYI